ncbi:MAG: aminotransferase class V-fold PLP-dependent enzyme, partial [Anaerolineae bacterium]|nr:aminotransferase class V-fold PLP-dependent enzyme [Anaerolineae bacterium]
PSTGSGQAPSTGSGQAPSTGSGQAPSTGLRRSQPSRSGRRPGVILYGGHDAARQTATVSFNVAGLEPSEVGLQLDEEYGILCRVGLHCAPSAHKTIGTFPTGTVRFGLSYLSTEEEVEAALRAVREMAG